MLRELQIYTGGSEDHNVFRGFNGRLVAKSPRTTPPGPKKITYDKFLCFMSLWFSRVMGLSVAAFWKQFITQSGRSGGAYAASNGGVPVEIWEQHGECKTLDAEKRYMKSVNTHLLSVSRAVVRLLTGLAPEVRTECGSAVDPPLVAGDDAPPDVVGVPRGAFSWS